MNQSNNKPDWVILSIIAIVILALAGMCISDYITYLTFKQKSETVRAAISKDWSAEHIQGFLNANKHE